MATDRGTQRDLAANGPALDAPLDGDPETVERILDAALESAALHGLRRTSVGDVAKAAGLSRPTLYKHVGNKEQIISATIAREVRVVIAEVQNELAGAGDPTTQLAGAITSALHLAREHPLLDRILRAEPESLLPSLTSDGGPVTQILRSEIERQFEKHLDGLEPAVAHRASDLLMRLIVSYAISAPDDPPEVTARAVATIVVAGTLELHERQTADPAYLPG